MSNEAQEAGSGSYVAIIAGVAILLLLIFYLILPGICLALWGDIPSGLMLLIAPLAWLYENFGPYEMLIDWMGRM